MTSYTARYRDGIGRWSIGYLQAEDMEHAELLAYTRFGQCAVKVLVF